MRSRQVLWLWPGAVLFPLIELLPRFVHRLDRGPGTCDSGPLALSSECPAGWGHRPRHCPSMGAHCPAGESLTDRKPGDAALTLLGESLGRERCMLQTVYGDMGPGRTPCAFRHVAGASCARPAVTAARQEAGQPTDALCCRWKQRAMSSCCGPGGT